MAATQFETSDARFAFPNLDEPDLKATFKFRIGHNRLLKALGNMPVASEGTPVSGYSDYIWTEYDELPLTSTYLVAFAVGDFDFTIADPLPNGVEFTVWGRPEYLRDNLGEYSKRIGSQVLQYFGDIFDYTFPLPKQDQISFPSKGGAMENWGLVTYGDQFLFCDENYISANDKNYLTSVNTHELAHQWFGDLVTNKWWDDIWLNEGFATYFQYVGGNHVASSFEYFKQFYIGEMQAILRDDAKPDSVPMLVEVDHPNEANFGDITYKRGGTMLKMIENFLTYPTMMEGLQRYLKAFAFSNAITDDLWVYLTTVGHENSTLGLQYDMKTLMDTWMKQKNYPLLTVTRDYASGNVNLRQSRFLTSEDTSGDIHDYQWFIPLTYTLFNNGKGDFETTKTSNFFLEPNTELNFPIGISDQPIIFNIQSTGYYRVNYDVENWNRIEEILKNNITAIHPVNRATVLSDAFFLAKAELESYNLPLQMVDFLHNEYDFVPLMTAIFIWEELLKISGLPSEGEALKTRLQDILLAKYQEIGIDELPGTATHLQKITQWRLVDRLCKQDITECVNDALAAFNQWQLSPTPEDITTNPINIEVHYRVYCTAVKHGDQADFDFLENQSTKSNLPQESRAMRNALSCSTQTDLLQKLLDNIFFDKKFDILAETIHDIILNNVVSDVAWIWLKNNCQYLKTTNDFKTILQSVSIALRELPEGSDQTDTIHDFIEACNVKIFNA